MSASLHTETKEIVRRHDDAVAAAERQYRSELMDYNAALTAARRRFDDAWEAADKAMRDEFDQLNQLEKSTESASGKRGEISMSVLYLHIDYESYKSLETQMKEFAETTHKSEGGFYHKSIRLKISPDLIIEVHAPLVGGYGHGPS